MPLPIVTRPRQSVRHEVDEDAAVHARTRSRGAPCKPEEREDEHDAEHTMRDLHAGSMGADDSSGAQSHDHARTRSPRPDAVRAPEHELRKTRPVTIARERRGDRRRSRGRTCVARPRRTRGRRASRRRSARSTRPAGGASARHGAEPACTSTSRRRRRELSASQILRALAPRLRCDDHGQQRDDGARMRASARTRRRHHLGEDLRRRAASRGRRAMRPSSARRSRARRARGRGRRAWRGSAEHRCLAAL